MRARIGRWLACLWLTMTLVLSLSSGSAAQARSWFTVPHGDDAVVAVSQLPLEARRTLAAIRAGGPFAYAKDGAIFGNFERRLPRRPRGFYTEYTVRTPGLRGRGARRIIAGDISGPAPVFYYTDDHYRSFRRIQE